MTTRVGPYPSRSHSSIENCNPYGYGTKITNKNIWNIVLRETVRLSSHTVTHHLSTTPVEIQNILENVMYATPFFAFSRGQTRHETPPHRPRRVAVSGAAICNLCLLKAAKKRCAMTHATVEAGRLFFWSSSLEEPYTPPETWR